MGNRWPGRAVCGPMTDQPPASGTARPVRSLAPASLALLILTAACTPGGTPGPSAGPSSSPSTEPTPTALAGIEHPTGATEIVLRFEEGGGFVPMEFIATQAPSFTLYGDGTVVFRDTQANPPPAAGSIIRSVPFQTIRLDEEGIQSLLEYALGQGGLGVAVGPYMSNAMDIPTQTFTVNAEGRTKQVVANGLSPDMYQPQDKLIITALTNLADRLRTFGRDVAGETAYAPAMYRGVLQKVDQAFGAVADWPWPDLQPTDFVSGVNEFLSTRTLTPEQVALLDVPDMQGGMLGFYLKKDDKLFSLAVRPLLPDEKA
jgi:hypothetical protein